MDPKTSETDLNTLSDILDELYDVRSHLEDIFLAMRCIRSELESDLENLLIDFDNLAEQMNDCSCHLLYLESETGIPSPASSPYVSTKDTFKPHSALPRSLTKPSNNQQRREK